MKSGELQELLLSILHKNRLMSVRDILKETEEATGREYAYTTIATTLTRLAKKDMVKSTDKKTSNKIIKWYSINEEAIKGEVDNMLTGLVTRFGAVGIKHLADVFNEGITAKELEEIRREFEV